MITKHNKPIGILGGTFNPIHHGHLRLALELYERLDLAKVLFIPSAQPPHREPPSVSSQLRLEMVQAAIAVLSCFNVDDRELQRQRLSYTVDTLNSLRSDYPHHSLGLILGMDAFLGLSSWHEWERLITLAHFFVVQRPNFWLPKQGTMVEFLKVHQTFNKNDLKKQKAGKIWLEEIPALNISATQIRSLIAAGKNPRYLLPQAVLDIINTQQLYR
jgi:nicotinate-nucleotide adenylyltransferase